MVLRIFDCDLCMTATLDLLARPHSSIPYVQMGFIAALQTSNLFSNDRFEFLPISQLISFAFKSVCFLFLAMCSFQLVCSNMCECFGHKNITRSTLLFLCLEIAHTLQFRIIHVCESTQLQESPGFFIFSHLSRCPHCCQQFIT